MKEKEPKNLEECLELLMQNSDKKSLNEWSETDEDSATAGIHHGLGTSIRNNWNLWNPDSELHKYFNTIGIAHADDMSGIIFDSLHRKINKKEINLEEQVTRYWKHWFIMDSAGAREVLPPNIEGVDEKYLKLYEEFKEEVNDGDKEE